LGKGGRKMSKTKPVVTEFEQKIYLLNFKIAQMLVEKNKKYGNSALKPIRIFSRSTSIEQLLVRIDDKLSRIKTANTDEDEDVLLDLIGYLYLLIIAKDKI
jgi:hypothetical protein